MNVVSEPKYDVMLVDYDHAHKSKLIMILTQPKPHPQLSYRDSVRVLVNIPSVVVSCIELKDAVLLELLIELAGGSVHIQPATDCD